MFIADEPFIPHTTNISETVLVVYELVVVRKRLDRVFHSNHTLTMLRIIPVRGLFAWKSTILA